MCRIVGGFEIEENGLKNSIEKMRDTMINGGPDDCGIIIKDEIVLAHRRLSIIDLSCYSHQPFCDDRYILVFNGEIYNYKEVAKTLQNKGVNCVARSDTEVLLSSFRHWGAACVEYFEGMFAFVIYDSLERKLYLFRDRFGVKPLYYYYDSHCFLFASELKALMAYPKLQKKIDEVALSYFLELGYIPSPFSILKNAYKLEQGHYLQIDLENIKKQGLEKAIEKVQYYDVKSYYRINNCFDSVCFQEKLHRSVSLRMVSDVNVGVCLSGGVDSSLVCAVLKESGYDFETFSISFMESSFNEGNYAKKIANILGVKNHQFLCSLEEAQNIIPSLPWIYDEPFGDSSAIPTLLLAQNIKKTHKVALSADGGDELGLGYDRYFWAFYRYRRYQKYKNLSFLLKIFNSEIMVKLLQQCGLKVSIDKFLRIKGQLDSKSFLEHYLVEITHLRMEGLRANGLPILNKWQIFDGDGLDYFKQMSYFDLQNYLSEDILTKTDRASMNVGLEMREPLLGKELVEFMVSLNPLENLIKQEDGQVISGKRIFKKYLERFLPRELIYRPKMGFGIPLEQWMRGNLRYLLDEILPYAYEYLDRRFLEKLISDFDRGERVDFAKIWYIYTFCAWRKEWNI